MPGVAEPRRTGASYTGVHAQRKRMMESILAERRKLEIMIREAFTQGQGNLGTDLKVLEQSRKMDQLVVDEMMLEELLKKNTQ